MSRAAALESAQLQPRMAGMKRPVSRGVKGVVMSQRDLINIWPVVCAAIVLGAAISLIV